jgi:hypothetical protein
MGRKGGGCTLSQLQSPVAFLPQEHLIPPAMGVVEPCVVKSMGIEVILRASCREKGMGFQRDSRRG